MQLNDTQTSAMTAAGLNLIAQALTIYDADLRLVLCTRRSSKCSTCRPHLSHPVRRFRKPSRIWQRPVNMVMYPTSRRS